MYALYNFTRPIVVVRCDIVLTVVYSLVFECGVFVVTYDVFEV